MKSNLNFHAHKDKYNSTNEIENAVCSHILILEITNSEGNPISSLWGGPNNIIRSKLDHDDDDCEKIDQVNFKLFCMAIVEIIEKYEKERRIT